MIALCSSTARPKGILDSGHVVVSVAWVLFSCFVFKLIWEKVLKFRTVV